MLATRNNTHLLRDTPAALLSAGFPLGWRPAVTPAGGGPETRAERWLRLKVVVLLAAFLEARIVSIFQIVLNDPRHTLDHADLEFLIQHLGAILPTLRELEFVAELPRSAQLSFGSTIRL